MSLLIPRLEWGDFQLTGTAISSSSVLNSISDTSQIEDGMICEGLGVPVDTSVSSHNSTSVTLSNNTTISGTSAFTFYNRFDFTYPPSKDSEDQFKGNATVVKSLSGLTQRQLNYVESMRDLEFGFITRANRDILRDNFFRLWAIYGQSFRYYDDQDDAEFFNYELSNSNFDDKRQVKKHPEFLYYIKFQFRRVIEE